MSGFEFETGTTDLELRKIEREKISFRHLPLSSRREMVYEILHELGARNISEKGNEIRHSCLLPFGNHAHGDTTGKSSINFDTLTVNCWVCGGGSFVWWLASVKGVETVHSVRDWLVTRIEGIQPLDDLLSFFDELYKSPETEPPPPVYDPRILDPWTKIVHPYLTEIRGIPESHVTTLRVGYDDFEKRIIIPHFWKGKLHGWQSRRMVDDGTPKYLTTPYLPRESTLYRPPVSETAILVEAPISVVRHADLPFVATFGAEVNKPQIDFLVRNYRSVVLWYDNDPAGWHATESVGEALSRYGQVFAIENPYEGDPGDLDHQTVVELLETARVPWSIWSRPTTENLMTIKKYGTGEVLSAHQGQQSSTEPERVEEDEEIEAQPTALSEENR